MSDLPISLQADKNTAQSHRTEAVLFFVIIPMFKTPENKPVL